MRGAARPKSNLQRFAQHASGLRDQLARQQARHLGERRVDGRQRHLQRRAREQHDRSARTRPRIVLRQRGEEFGVARENRSRRCAAPPWRSARSPARRLRHRLHGGDAAFDRGDRGVSVDGVGLAWRFFHRQRRVEDGERVLADARVLGVW